MLYIWFASVDRRPVLYVLVILVLMILDNELYYLKMSYITLYNLGGRRDVFLA